MTDWGASGRTDEYSAHVVDPFTLQETGETVDMVSGEGNVTWRYDSDSYVSATINLINSTASDRLLRIKHSITMPDGTSYGETLGTFFVDDCTEDDVHGSVNRSASCYSTLCRFTDDVLVTDFSRPAGTNIVDEVRYIVEVDGGRLKVGQGVNTSQLHTVDVWFQIGTNRADVLRTIASWTSCELGVDDDGYVTWERYLPPESRAESYVFSDDSSCVYKAGMHVSDTLPDSINRVVAHYSRLSKSDDDTLPLSDSVIVELPSSHPYSYERIGRKKTYDYSFSSPVDHATLQSEAQRYLDEHSGGVTYIEIEHASIPGLRAGDVVRYINSLDGPERVDARCLVEEISMDLVPGGMCSTKLRRLS